MSQLPSSWSLTPLLAVSELLRGVTYTKEVAASLPAPDRLPVLRANNLQGRAFDFSDLVYVPSTLVSEQQRIRSGDVVIATSSGSISVVGKAVQSRRNMDAGFGAFCGVLRPAPSLNSRYFGHFFSTEAYRTRVSAMARGSNINNLKREHFESLTLPIAPQAEQQRIADKLDTVLARVDACRDRLTRVAGLLKRFRQSVLAAATSGRLTEEWRASNGLTRETWSVTTVGDLITGIEAGLNVSCEERPPADGERGLVKISAVTWGVFDQDQSKTLNADAKVSELLRIREGDFLISRANTLELVGACVLVHSISRNLYLSDKVLRLVMPARVKPWLLCVLRSQFGRRQIEQLASGNQLSMRNLSQVGLKSIQVPMPRPNEIGEIVRCVETLFAYANRLEVRLAQAQTAVDRLTPSLLAKAFRGELVPQDPADEPAAELLKRLAASRPAPAAKSRRPRQDQPA